MHKSIISTTALALSAIFLVTATCGQAASYGNSGLPTNRALQSKLVEVGDSLGWALMYEDPHEGLFVWRLMITSLEHPALEARFTWYMKRVGEEIAVDDPMLALVELSGTESLRIESRRLQEEFKRRWLALVGPVSLRGPTPSTHSAEKYAEAISSTVNATEVPPVAGDMLIVISRHAKIKRNGAVVDTAPRGTVLEIRGFDGARLKVRYRRAGTVSRTGMASLDHAIAMTSETIRRNPHDSNAYAMRGNAWTFWGDFQKAFADLDEAIRLNARSAFAFHRRGFIFGAGGNYAKAISDFNMALRLQPNDALILNERAAALYLGGEHGKALADFHAALRRDPQCALVYSTRGAVWAQKGDDEKAIADFSEAIRLDPDDAQTFFNRGKTWARKGARARAAKDFQEAARLDPKFLFLVPAAST
jgi:tetratricopeptide (TPR) repeat protein